jgi:uncharacterized protein YdaU (DUF1376 family)
MLTVNYVSLYFRDFYAAVLGRDSTFTGAYWNAILVYWMNDTKGLPDNPRGLRNICAVWDDEDWAEIEPVLFNREAKEDGHFFYISEGAWHQKRALREYRLALAAFEGGRKGGFAKARKAKRAGRIVGGQLGGQLLGSCSVAATKTKRCIDNTLKDSKPATRLSKIYHTTTAISKVKVGDLLSWKLAEHPTKAKREAIALVASGHAIGFVEDRHVAAILQAKDTNHVHITVGKLRKGLVYAAIRFYPRNTSL